MDTVKNNTANTSAKKASKIGWSKSDTVWALGLYGTAVGAGTLFLPINAGVGGLIPLLVMAILALPMTYFAHRGMTRFVLSSSNPGADITEVVEEHFGPGMGESNHPAVLFCHLPYLAGL